MWSVMLSDMLLGRYIVDLFNTESVTSSKPQKMTNLESQDGGQLAFPIHQ